MAATCDPAATVKRWTRQLSCPRKSDRKSGAPMKKLLLAGVGLAAMIAGPALAADLAPVYKAAPAPYVSSWTGFYAGIGVGGRWMDSDWTTTATFAPIGI